MAVIRGKYRIVAHLRGGDATESSIVAVETEGDGSQLAVLKRLKLGADADEATLESFAVETTLCKKLDHPNVTKLLEAGHYGGEPVLVFEYLEGVTLARLRSRAVRQAKGVPLALTLRIVADIAKGLAYAHGLKDDEGKPLGLIHRDVSAENVLVTYDGQVKLTDFGMATTIRSAKTSRTDRVRGNVAYMAPEQARPEYSLDARADIFALGVILWELCTGKRLWEGLSEVDVLARLADAEPIPPPSSVVPDLPVQIDVLCSQALTKTRDERFDSVSELLDALEKAAIETKLSATRHELQSFVALLFADELMKMRTVIAEARATPPGTPSSRAPLPAIGAPRPKGASRTADPESDPRLRFGVATPQEEPSKRVVEVIEIPVPQPDTRFRYAIIGISIVAIAAVTILAVVSPPEEKKVDATPYVAPTRPSSPAGSASPSQSGYVEPDEITVDIRVTPPEANLFVDGVKVTNPHRRRVVPGTFNHTIRAEADGFEPRTTSALFDKERSIELALVPLPKVVGARPAPSASAAPTSKPSATAPSRPTMPDPGVGSP